MNNNSVRGEDSRTSESNIQDEDEDKIVDELTRIHEEVACGGGSTADVNLSEQLGSARRVMELLASMRPRAENDTIGLRTDDETQTDDASIMRSLPSGEENIPQSIGRFEVRELLGYGGFGMVFRAHDARLERDVALKVPTANSLLNSEARHRFERECRAVASLSHPNIVPVFEIGNDGPVAFLASELIEGEDLSNWVQAHGIPDASNSALAMIRIAEAVQHAHSRGVIHRDLKPANVLLEISENADAATFDPDSVRITDFGLAKFCDEEASLTQTGSVLGTPAFAAPEQLRGEVESSGDELADVYSLGAVLYFLLTGKAPFAADSLLGLIQKVQNEDPLHPQKIGQSVPQDLAAICLKAMDKDPRNRYRNAWEFRGDIESFLRNEPTVARPMTSVRKLGKWCRRNPVVSILAAMFSIALIAGFSATYYQWCVAQENLEEVTRHKNRSDVLLQKTEESIDAMLNSAAEAMKDLPSMTKVRRKMLEDALSIQISILEEERDSGVALMETVESLTRVARIQQELGEFSDAKKSTKAAIELVEGVEPPSSGLLVDASALYRRLSILEIRLGDAAAAQEAALQMERLLKKVDASELDAASKASLRVAQLKSLRILGEVAERSDQLGDAAKCFESAVKIGEEILEEAPEGTHAIGVRKELMSAWNSLAIVRRATGELSASHDAYIASLKINSELMEEGDSNRELREKFSTTAHNFGNLLFQQQQFDEAGIQYQKAFDILSELCDKFPSVYRYHRRLPSTLSGLALIRKKSGDFVAARETTRLSIELLSQSRENFGETEGILSSLALAKRSLASLDSALKEYDSAVESFRLAEVATRELVELYPSNPKYRHELSLTIGNEAGCLIVRNQFDHATERLLEAKKEGEKAIELGPGRIRYRDSLDFLNGKLIEAMIGSKRFKDAEQLMSELTMPECSNESLLYAAQAASRGVELQLQENDENRFEESIVADVESIVDRIFGMLEAAIAKGLSAEDLSPEQFKAIAEDERFGQLLTSGE